MGKCDSRKDYLSMLIFVERILCEDDGDSLEEKGYCEVEVRGVDLEFDNEKLATILGVHSENGICEYIEEVKSAIDRDETFSKVYSFYVKDHELPLWRLAHFGFEAFGVPLVIKKGEEPKKYDFFEDTFLTMCELTGEDGIWWIGSGENRRRDDDEATQEEEAEGDDEGNKDDFGGSDN
ncbi:hypothetical protein Dimus_018649 [Dionaea muscipula]